MTYDTPPTAPAGTATYARTLSLSNLLREPALRRALHALNLPPGSRGLDAGCGIGLHTVLLADAVGPAGSVTGIDVIPEFLVLGEQLAAERGVAERVTFEVADIDNLPFEDDVLDWVWSVDTVHTSLLDDPVATIEGLARVVRPGGTIAILFWSAQKLLPGYPLLEAQLDAAFAATAPYLRGILPREHFMNALGWLQAAGLSDPRAQTFVADVHAPLSDDQRAGLAMTFDMFWGGIRLKVPAVVWAEFERLCRPDSPDFIVNRPDYYALLTYSLFRGTVPLT